MEDYEQVKDLRYYHPSDEAGEAWATMVRLLHYVGTGCPLGDLLMQEIKEQAKESERFTIEQFGSLDDDFTTGTECW